MAGGSGNYQKGYFRNDTKFDGTGNLNPIQANDAVNVSFFAKKVGDTGGVGRNTINVYLSEDGNSEWTCIVGKRAEGSTSDEDFTVTNDWTRLSYTGKAPSENGDNDYTGGVSVATWMTASIQITGSHYVPDVPPNSEREYATAYDDFKITANKPQVHASNEGILIYHSGDNYIEMGAGGLEIRGGDIQANSVESPTITSAEFQVKDKIINFESGSDIIIGTQDTTEQAAADLYLSAGHSFADVDAYGAGGGGGNIILMPGSGSGTDGQVSNGQGVVVIGPTYTPRLIISGSVIPTLGANDMEVQFKDPLGDKGVCFFTKQSAGLGGATEGLFKVVCPNENGRLALGSGGWSASNNIVITETGRVIIQPTGAPNDVADSSYELNVVGDINYSGNLTNVSDRRLKIDIEDITGSLEIVNNLEPVRFNKIGYRTIVPDTGNPRRDGNNVTQTSMSEDNTVITGSRKEIGLIAQDVEAYIPEIVMSGSVDGHYSVDYVMLTAHLIGAIKELKEEVDALKNVSHSHG